MSHLRRFSLLYNDRKISRGTKIVPRSEESHLVRCPTCRVYCSFVAWLDIYCSYKHPHRGLGVKCNVLLALHNLLISKS